MANGFDLAQAMNAGQAFRANRLALQGAQEQRQRQNLLTQALQQGDFQTALAIDPKTTTNILKEQRLQQAQEQAQEQGIREQMGAVAAAISNPNVPEPVRRQMAQFFGPRLAQAGLVDRDFSGDSIEELETKALTVLGQIFPESEVLQERPKRGGEIVTLQGPQGQTLTRRRDDPEVDQLLQQGFTEPGGRGTERDRKIAELMQRGMSRQDAEDLASGRVRVVGPDQFGNVELVNITDGTRRPLQQGGQTPTETPARDSGQPGIPQRAAQGQEFDVRGTELGRAATQGTGPIATGKAALSALIGPFVPGQLFPDTQQSRQRLRVFNQEVLRGLVNNPRFPVAEQERIRGFLPDPDRIAQDPDDVAQNVGELRRFLSRKLDSNTQTLERENITLERQGEIADQNAEIRSILRLMDEGIEPGAAQGQDDIDTQLQQLEQRERELEQRIRRLQR